VFNATFNNIAVLFMVVGLPLTIQSVRITTNIVKSNPGGLYLIQLYVICDRSVVFSGYSSFIHQ
jgi:hypothetical protein